MPSDVTGRAGTIPASGMQVGSRGMKAAGTPVQRYEVMCFDHVGTSNVFARH